MFFGFLEESGYMHLQMTKPDTAGAFLYFALVVNDTFLISKTIKHGMHIAAT